MRETENLLYKYIKGEATELETQYVIEWIDSSNDNYNHYQQIRLLHDSLLWSDELEVKENSKLIRTNFLRTFYLAASLAIGVISTSLFYQFYLNKENTKFNTIETPCGQRLKLSLSDGSTVWLNSNSSLTFPTRFSSKQREVSLMGEAYFEVQSNPSSPFIVNTKNYKVKAVGTQFNINSYDENLITTSLVSGRVEVLLPNNTTVEMKPNQEFILENSYSTIKESNENFQFSWKEGILDFNGLSLAEFIPLLHNYFDYTIEIKGQKLIDSKVTFTGKFYINDGIRHILRVLQSQQNFDFKINKNEIIIY